MRPVAIITGGAKGIGRAISLELAHRGWDLHLWGRDGAALEAFATEVKGQYGANVTLRSVDLSDLHGIPTLFSEWRADPTKLPLALVCNAGNYGTLGNLEAVDFDSWKRSFDLNFFAVAQLAQEYIRIVGHAPRLDRNRKLVLMGGSGLGGSRVWPGISAYACAKGAINRLVEVIHEESVALGLDVNCVAPGAVKTGITDQAAKVGSALGPLFDATRMVLESGGDSPELAAKCIATLLDAKTDGLSGRLISAKWDGRLLEDAQFVAADGDLLRLRRIDNDLFEKVKK